VREFERGLNSLTHHAPNDTFGNVLHIAQADRRGKMDLRDARTGEMVQFSEEWGKHAAIFQKYPLTAPYVETIAEVGGELEQAESGNQQLDEGKKAALGDQMKLIDNIHDTAARKLHGGVDWLAMDATDQKPLYLRFLEVVFSEGLAVLNTSPRNQAGVARMLQERVAKQPELATVLDKVFDGTPLRDYFERMISAGLEGGELAAELASLEDVGQQMVTEYRARQRWISMVGLLRRTAAFAGWSAEDYDTVFGPLETQLSSR
jgi:hypothetical protein